MTTLAADLIDISNAAGDALAQVKEPWLVSALAAIDAACSQMGRAWSGSNIGYHATTYVQGFQPKPANVHFSSEWGLGDHWPVHTPSELWATYAHDQVIQEVMRRAGEPNEGAINDRVASVRKTFYQLKEHAISVLSVAGLKSDTYLLRKLSQIEKLEAPNASTVLKAVLPNSVTSRDSLAMHQGIRPAPHQSVAAISVAANVLVDAIEKLEAATREAAVHMRRLEDVAVKPQSHGGGIFIGHGRSAIWRELKDFLEDRLRLRTIEFNCVPVAGMTTPERLKEILDDAAFAFLVMTAEDPTPAGTMNARLNVIHEVGMFQGRLGYKRAIVLLEDGCEEFSNIHGINQLRFPQGRIAAVFEDIRAVMEREKLV